jgi:hypothetical protein
MQKKGSAEQGEKFLQQQLQKNPNNELSQWTLNKYEEKNFNLTQNSTNNSNYRVLQQWIAMQ